MSPLGKSATVFLLLASLTVAHAGLISGFEQGLDGWEYIGDVSIQTADIGTSPTQGQNMAFVTTMCDILDPAIAQGPYNYCLDNSGGQGRDLPYSGVSSPESPLASEFINDVDELGFSSGESGALKTQFYAPRRGLLSFDWNYIGEALDWSYFSLWSDHASTYSLAEYLYNGEDWFPLYPDPRVPTDVELCSRWLIGDGDSCDSDIYEYDYPALAETGWQTTSVEISQSGWYWIGFAMGEIADGSAPSLMALDNVRYKVVPEPGTLPLLGIGLLGLGLARRRKRA